MKKISIEEQLEARINNAANDLQNELVAAGKRGVSIVVKKTAKGFSVTIEEETKRAKMSTVGNTE